MQGDVFNSNLFGVMYIIMRRIYWGALVSVLLICGCSSDNDNQFNDDLLSGTEWRYGRFEDDNYLDQIPNQNVTEETYFDALVQYFPGVELKCIDGEIECSEESSVSKYIVSEPRAKLSFTKNGVLYYGDSGYTAVTTTKVAHYSQIVTYASQSYVSTVNPYISLEITKDAIMLYQTRPDTEQRIEYEYLSLNDFKYTKVWDETILTDTERVYNDIVEEVFSSQREAKEVVLTNEHRKWIGTLDTDAWTLSFVQIIPERKNIPIFKLK